MATLTTTTHHRVPSSSTAHPEFPIPEEPEIFETAIKDLSLNDQTPSSSSLSAYSSDGESPTTSNSDSEVAVLGDEAVAELDNKRRQSSNKSQGRRLSTRLVFQTPEDVGKVLGETDGTQYVGKVCCGGGCCMLKAGELDKQSVNLPPIQPPTNDAYGKLGLKLGNLSLQTKLTETLELPPQTVFLQTVDPDTTYNSTVDVHPPTFVKPHAPYDVFSAPVFHARELTKPGAEKRTFHFDLDVTDYPSESGNVDFVVGGAIGVQAPNEDTLVEEVFDSLGIPRRIRDKPVQIKTTSGRWPTIWGDDEARELTTTRRELLTWCSDIQSYPPTKPLLRLLAEHADDPVERHILMFLSSQQGQAAFCDLRTGPHITLSQLFNAFPSSHPPLDHLLSVLNSLMPRFYSLSQDPFVSCLRENVQCRRIIEIAVTVHETSNWRGGPRMGLASGYLERKAREIIDMEAKGLDPRQVNIRVPIFRGLMANPLAREFVTDGPMLLIGAGVGVAPFRGFVQRRLRSANCANKVWVLQGIRDSLLDELYSGEWGVEEDKVKKVVQSRRGRGKYVQEEVRNQADLVWFIINAVDGRIFVCGSSAGMGQGVESALVDVAMAKGRMNHDEAVAFWEQKKKEGQYIAETW